MEEEEPKNGVKVLSYITKEELSDTAKYQREHTRGKLEELENEFTPGPDLWKLVVKGPVFCPNDYPLV